MGSIEHVGVPLNENIFVTNFLSQTALKVIKHKNS